MNNVKLVWTLSWRERVGWNPTLYLKTRAVVMSASICLTSTRERVFMEHFLADGERFWKEDGLSSKVIQFTYPVFLYWIGGKNLPFRSCVQSISHICGCYLSLIVRNKTKYLSWIVNRPCLVFTLLGCKTLVCDFRCKDTPHTTQRFCVVRKISPKSDYFAEVQDFRHYSLSPPQNFFYLSYALLAVAEI